MNIDQRIKEELETTAQDLDNLTGEKEGMMNMVLGSFSGGMGRWVSVVYAATLITTGFMLWTGFHFFTSEQDQAFWGICLLVALFVQVALKQWVWMEMSRSSLMREIKRVEVAVSRLSSKLEAESK